MLTLIRWIISLVVAVAAVLFALGNRADVSFVWSPFHDPVTLPLFLPVLAALIVGFIAGGTLVWLNAHPVRAARRRQRKEIEKLKLQVKEAEARAALPTPAPPYVPALPSE
jgi:uncharacterized integral membrane protein